jgi:nicotinamide-nucleotide amidase
MVEEKAGKSVYDQDLLNEIAAIMSKTGATLSVAESVTSGCLQTAFSLAEGATQFFQGGITAYEAAQKTRLLDVEPIYGKENECVNRLVAEQMALGANRMFLSRYAISITGFAQSIPGHEFKNPYAYFAIAQGQEIVKQGFLEVEDDQSCSVQEAFARKLLVIFLEVLKK